MTFSGKGFLHLAYGFISVVFGDIKKLDTFGISTEHNGIMYRLGPSKFIGSEV